MELLVKKEYRFPHLWCFILIVEILLFLALGSMNYILKMNLCYAFFSFWNGAIWKFDLTSRTHITFLSVMLEYRRQMQILWQQTLYDCLHILLLLFVTSKNVKPVPIPVKIVKAIRARPY